MTIWAIADLHLSFGVPSKHMRVFGEQWENYTDKIEQAWRSAVSDDDLVLIPGDISWAMRLEEARLDLDWIGQLPGTKVLLKGNHDYWWSSLSKIKTILPPSCHLIQNNSFNWNGASIAGARLWDVPGLSFNEIIDFKDFACVKKLTETDESDESRKIYERELVRLESSLKAMDTKAKLRIAMTHYPPVGPNLQETDVSRLLEKYGVQICVFGHLHNVKPHLTLFGVRNGISYQLTACDYLNSFKPIKIADNPA
ncbi:putative phosphoesterase [Candidatus Protochlamydia naegleriophila]|uniref:Putative phosphoesterase n=1 Tax=Candidatus Protochlamydia naegleriophila TaxID=389348 RepID=A0A0U5EUP2_9BACT|nr:metallophosphoesterase [Candidatus Protochlamydia naegleriophila]CUI17889.1 putative phosphoesterase [Candidatus Protochlamydia naegleriophila]